MLLRRATTPAPTISQSKVRSTMTARKRTFRLGLALMSALSIFATSATAAQAAEFRVDGGTFASKGVASVPINGTQEAGGGELLIPNLGVEIFCAGGTLTGTLVAGGTATAEVLYEGCEVLGAEETCEIYKSLLDLTNHLNEGHILVNWTGILVLHEGKHYLVVKGIGANELFTTVFFHGPECPLLGIEAEITGLFALGLPSFLSELSLQPFEVLLDSKIPTLVLAANSRLKFLGEPMELHGKNFLVLLEGTLKHHKWGGQ
jgi:hypothetical protein